MTGYPENNLLSPGAELLILEVFTAMWNHSHMLSYVIILFPGIFSPEMMLQNHETQLFGADVTLKILLETRMHSCLRLIGL